MALMSDAVMVLLNDADDPGDHDDWHTYEHMHERLSIPGFVRGTRWIRAEGAPRYLIVYEIAGPEMARSPAYLERLDHPTAWTAHTMKQIRGMQRGFCRVAASAGYGLGSAALCLRHAGAAASLDDLVVALADERGMASVHSFEIAAAGPMTREQSIRGRDDLMSNVLLATAYDAEALRGVCDRHLDDASLERRGIDVLDRGSYRLAFTATAAEVARTKPNPPVDPLNRPLRGCR